MKLIHLSDLHIGKCVLEQSMIEDQKYILNQIKDIVVKEKVDAVLITGDVYDKGIPSSEAVLLLDNFLTSLIELGKKVFIISGNHDSKERLSFGKNIFKDKELYIETEYEGTLRKIVLNDEKGALSIYMLPFVKPALVRKYFDEEIKSYNDAVKLIIEKVQIDSLERNILMVHQFVTGEGISPLRSEEEVYSLGGIDNVDVALFDNFSYVAMGHVHRPQKLLRETVRYAGSPLKYSFSECLYDKSVPIIDFDKEVKVSLVSLIPRRDMRVIEGFYDDLIYKRIDNLGDTNDYLKIVLLDENEVMDAISKLREVYPNILKLEFKNSRIVDKEDNYSFSEVRDRDELSLFREFYEFQNNIDMDEKRLEIMKKIIEELKE